MILFSQFEQPELVCDFEDEYLQRHLPRMAVRCVRAAFESHEEAAGTIRLITISWGEPGKPLASGTFHYVESIPLQCTLLPAIELLTTNQK